MVVAACLGANFQCQLDRLQRIHRLLGIYQLPRMLLLGRSQLLPENCPEKLAEGIGVLYLPRKTTPIEVMGAGAGALM